jgi:hypothetical protein
MWTGKCVGRGFKQALDVDRKASGRAFEANRKVGGASCRTGSKSGSRISNTDKHKTSFGFKTT